jgi:hypothetical protein
MNADTKLGAGARVLTPARLRHSVVRPQRVIGIDHSFYHLYIARTLVAPDGDFVCGKVDASLPFATGRLAFAFCSDAFHYFIGKAGCARELERVTAAHGTIALATVRSARAHHLSPGIPLTPAGYAALFSDRPCRLVPEDDVWRRYLEGLGPALERGVPEERLDRAPVLTCVTTGNAGIFRDHGPFGPWPHGAGHLGLNPLYRVTASNAHTVTLARTYPSAYYEEENRDSLSYLPEMVTVTRDGITALERQERTPEVERLVERFVAIDLPPRWS